MTEQTCPLLTLVVAKRQSTETHPCGVPQPSQKCLGELCAWWYSQDERCALVSICHELGTMAIASKTK